jgi:hypothetical protein
VLGDAFEGKRLSSGQHIVESANDGKRCVLVISDCDAITVEEVKVRFVPLKDVLPAFLVFLLEINLRAEEANLKFGKIEPVAFKSSNSSGIIQDFVAKPPLLIGDELSRDSIHGERSREIDERPRKEVRFTVTDALRAPRIHDELKVVIVGEKVAFRCLQDGT